MNKERLTYTGKQGNAFWNFIDTIQGDKVVWIIVFILTMISALAIFSSTSQLTGDSVNRIDLIRKHSLFILIGYVLIFLIYKVRKIGWFRVLSQFGYIISLIMLLFLTFQVNLGFIRAAKLNDVAWRVIVVGNQQIHVFEIVKVAMVMYLAWAINAYKQDEEEIRRNGKSSTFSIANSLGRRKRFAFMAQPFWKRVLYIYIPMLSTCGLVMMGSNSSGIFIGGIMLATLLIGGLPAKEIGVAIMGVLAVIIMAVAIYFISGRTVFTTVETAWSRINAKYDTERLIEIENDKTLGKYSPDWYAERSRISQPYSGRIAIHEGKLLGKGSGNSTQKHVVTHIYSDYMYSFIVEEYGLLGGILVIILYVSLLARGSMIARSCTNEFAKIAVGGLSFLITAQAFMHIFVNVGIGPMTGQTLPLLSDGRFAYLTFCIAFGIILSISRMAREQIREEEEAAAPLYESDSQQA
ncbi:MAG: FtsW/RodA/SpoVE family cell cycle protein [Bacteroidales bacterium]|nr:hypothetical protein [Bacteroidales bacterium]MBQ6688059.1 FtsW/RodA/SpoVE family cell cycle protein [Bacteroidales bacterium]